MRSNAEKYNVTMVLIMVDDEGETCSPDQEERIQAAINHHKWVDISKFLGCHAIRTNCRGPRNAPKKKALEWAADTYKRLLDYAAPMGIRVCIENHGGLSDDVNWMDDLFKRVNHPFLGRIRIGEDPAAGSTTMDIYRRCFPMQWGCPIETNLRKSNQPA